VSLTDEQIEALRQKFGKVGVVEWNGHQIVFRKPTRDDCRDYRRMRESPTEKGDSIESLCQKSLCAFDGELDVNRARTIYTTVFLEEYPLFASVPKVVAVMSALTGMVEEEDALDLGKGVSFRSARRPSTPAASPNGSGTALEPPKN
jgi:hypothetical protein